MKILARTTIPINVIPGDTIALYYKDEFGKETKVLSETIKESHTFTEGIIYQLGKKECKELEVSYGLAGAFLEK